MADFFLRSTDGSDADNGTTWALAKATMAGAFAAMAAGDRLFVSDNHAETQASAMTLTSPGTAASPCQVLCVDDAGDPANPTTLATTATVTTTGASGISFIGFAYVNGVTFNVGTVLNTASASFISTNPWGWIIENGKLALLTTATASVLNIGAGSGSGDDQQLRLRNTPVQFGAVGQKIVGRAARFIWENTPTAILGTVPTTLLTSFIAYPAFVVLRGVDLSALGSAKNLVDQSIASASIFQFINCKLGSGVTIVTGTNPSPGGTIVEVNNCDAGDTNYRNERYEYHGSVVTVTDVVRSGGASDGSTAIGWKMVSTANAKFLSFLQSFSLIGWVSSTGSKTFTVQYIHGEAAALKNDEIWLEVEYLGTSGFPLSVLATSAKANALATAADNTADSAQDWDNGLTARANSTTYAVGDIRRAATPNGRAFVVTAQTGVSNASEPAAFATAADGDAVTDNLVTWRCMRREKLSVTVTVNEIGPVRATLCVGKASLTVWVDPQVGGGNSSPAEWMVPGGGQVSVLAGGGGLLKVGGMSGGMQR